MRYLPWLVPAALTLSVAGMMMVIAAVLGVPLFIPGVVLIVIGVIGWAAAGMLHAVRAQDGAAPRSTSSTTAR